MLSLDLENKLKPHPDIYPSKHPNLLWYLALLSALMCIPFGVINSLLVLYLQHVMHLNQHEQYATFSAYNAMLFALPLIGGFTAGRFGYKKALVFSTMLCVLGALVLCVPEELFLHLGLSLFATGVGMYVPTYLVLVGKLYRKNDPRWEGGYTIVYVISNMGFLVSAFMGGYIQKYFGFGAAFITGGLCMALAFLSFPWMLSKIKCIDGLEIPVQSTLSESMKLFWMVLIALITTPICYFLLTHAKLSNQILLGVVILEILGVLILALRQKDRRDKFKLFAFLILSITSMGFWSLYILEPSLLTMFIQNNVNRNLFGSEIPPSVFYGLNPFFIIVLGSLLSVLWVRLEKRKLNPSLPSKFALSLSSMAIGIGIFTFCIVITGFDLKIALFWVVLGYLFLTTGELLIGPIGQSMVGKLVPHGYEGLLMGVWQTFVGLSAAVADYLADMGAVPEDASYNQSSHIYFHAFLMITITTLILAAISWLIAPFVRRAIGKNG